MTTKSNLLGVIGFLFGALAGALVAIFNTPQSGKKTRAQIREKSGELVEKAVGRYELTRSQAAQFVRGLKEDISTRTSKLLRVGRNTLDREKELLKQSSKQVQKVLKS
ncbi:MAG TPA: YtxH domain-containing protein [Anaerolineales bacterium]|nr:YtxH domain-containing protein [Anaerolineales bacterium]